jgi:hypothetical protein
MQSVPYAPISGDWMRCSGVRWKGLRLGFRVSAGTGNRDVDGDGSHECIPDRLEKTVSVVPSCFQAKMRHGIEHPADGHLGL